MAEPEQEDVWVEDSQGWRRVALRPDGTTLSIRKMTAAGEEGAQHGR